MMTIVRRCITRSRSLARVAVRIGLLGLVLVSIAACDGDVPETPSVTVPTRAPPADASPAVTAESTDATPPATPVAAVARPASTSVPTAPAAPAGTPTPPEPTPAPTAAPGEPPPTATGTVPASSPGPSPTASPAASPSPSPDPTTAAATASPTATAQPVASPPPTPTQAPTPLRASIGRVATALSVDGLQRPQDVSETFGLEDRVYISVEFRDVREGARLGIRWKSDNCGGEYETGPQESLRRGYFAFFVEETTCVGEHLVEITVDGVVAAVTEFTVLDQPSVARE